MVLLVIVVSIQIIYDSDEPLPCFCAPIFPQIEGLEIYPLIRMQLARSVTKMWLKIT